jgi:hypothetical protein
MSCGCIRCAPCREALDHKCPVCGEPDSDTVDSIDIIGGVVGFHKKLLKIQIDVTNKLDRIEHVRERLELDLEYELEKLQNWVECFRSSIISAFDAELAQVYLYEKTLESTFELVDTHLNLCSAPEGELAFLSKLSETKIDKIPKIETKKFIHYQTSVGRRIETYNRKLDRAPEVNYLVTDYDRIYYWTNTRRTRQLMSDGVLVLEYPKSTRGPNYHSSTAECDYFIWKNQIYLVSDFEWEGPFPLDSIPQKAYTVMRGFVRKDTPVIKIITEISSISFSKDSITFTDL